MDGGWFMRGAFIAGIVAVASGCRVGDGGTVGDPTVASEAGLMSAWVRYVDVEGGCWALELDDGRRVQPLGLEEALRVDGLKVEIRIEPAADVLTTCQVGEIVRVIEVRRR